MPPLTVKRLKSSTNDLDKLIEGITDIIPADHSNFSRCQKFVASNFLYHRYMDVIPSDVWIKADKLHHKLVIQAQTSRANAFDALVKNLRKSCTSSTEDAISSVLFVLMKISQGTSHLSLSVYHKPLGKDIEIEVDTPVPNPVCLSTYDAHSWEPISVLQRGIVFSSSSEDEEEEEILQFFPNQPEILNTPSSDSGFEQTPDVEERSIILSPSTPSRHTSPVLLENSKHKQWLDEHILTVNDSLVVKEDLILMEILWMLQGTTNLSYFNYGFNHFSLKDRVKFSHLSHDSLMKFVEQFCEVATYTVHLKAFVSSILNSDFKLCHLRSRVFQAFAYSLSRILQDVLKPLQSFETEILLKSFVLWITRLGKTDGNLIASFCIVDKCWTLIKLRKEIQDVFSNLKLLYRLFNDGVADIECNASIRTRVCQLLTILQRKLDEATVVGENPYWINILLTLLIESSKPYLEFVDQLITGKLEDHFGEFVIERNSSVRAEDEFYWDNVLILHQAEREYFMFDQVLPLVLSAGKSAQIIDKTGHEDSHHYVEGHLYDAFLNDFLKYFNLYAQASKITACETTVADTKNLYSWMDKIARKNTLLTLNFQQFSKERILKKEFKPKTLRQLSILDASVETTKPFSIILENCLIPLIIEKCGFNSEKALSIMEKEFQLSDHLDLVRMFYLLEAGESMVYFCAAIFNQLLEFEKLTEIVCPETYLLELTEALSCSELSRNMKVSISHSVEFEAKDTTGSCLNELKKLQLVYNVPWPVNIILTKEAMNIYQSIFTFLLQIKYAKFALDQMHYSALKTCKDSSKMHVMYLLRMKFVCSVGAIHSYFMIRILHTTQLELRKEMTRAKNIKDLVEAHRNYLKILSERCFLVSHLCYAKKVILKILHLAIQFSRLWNSNIDKVNYEFLSSLEDTHKNSVQFLCSMMKIVQKKGNCPHSEILALSLMSHNTIIRVVPGENSI